MFQREQTTGSDTMVCWSAAEMWEILSLKDTFYNRRSTENLVKARNNSQLLKKTKSYF